MQGHDPWLSPARLSGAGAEGVGWQVQAGRGAPAPARGLPRGPPLQRRGQAARPRASGPACATGCAACAPTWRRAPPRGSCSRSPQHCGKTQGSESWRFKAGSPAAPWQAPGCSVGGRACFATLMQCHVPFCLSRRGLLKQARIIDRLRISVHGCACSTRCARCGHADADQAQLPAAPQDTRLAVHQFRGRAAAPPLLLPAPPAAGQAAGEGRHQDDCRAPDAEEPLASPPPRPARPAVDAATQVTPHAPQGGGPAPAPLSAQVRDMLMPA